MGYFFLLESEGYASPSGSEEVEYRGIYPTRVITIEPLTMVDGNKFCALVRREMILAN